MSKIYDLNFIEYILIVIPALIALAFAMIKIHDIPLTKYIFLFLEFSIKPKGRIWDHRGISSVVAPDLGENIAEATDNSVQTELDLKAKRAANLKELTRALDSGSFEHLRDVEHDDMDVSHDDDLVTQAYFGHKQGESETENMYWRTKEAHKKMLSAFAAMPVTKLKKGSVEAMHAQQEIAKVKKEVEEEKAAKLVQSEAEATSPTTTSQPQATATPATEKKPRKRQRPVPQPVRKGTVNTVDKTQPTVIDAQAQKTKTPPQQKPQDTNSSKDKDGEFDFRELEKGEIEINLD